MRKTRRRLGRSLRQRRAQEERAARAAANHVREQYARFCARGEWKYDDRYKAALYDFVKLVEIPGVAQVALNPEATLLFVGTECLEQYDFQGQLRVIGHIIVTFSRTPPSYTIESCTPMDGFAHPHARHGDEFCMSDGKQEIHIAITDGEIPAAMSVIMTALKMVRGTVSVTSALRPLCNWPLKEK